MSAEKKICLSVKGLTKEFGFGRNRNVAVDHVNMDLNEGEVVSIVGESGSGKTTLSKIDFGNGLGRWKTIPIRRRRATTSVD